MARRRIRRPAQSRRQKQNAATSRVKILTSQNSWEKAMSGSQRRYLIIHVREELKETPAGLPIAQFPMLLVYYKQECIEECSPQASSAGIPGHGRNASTYAFPSTAMRFLELLSVNAPKPKPITAIMGTCAALLTMAGILFFARSRGNQVVEEEEEEHEREFHRAFPGFAARGQEQTLSGLLGSLDPDAEFDFETAYNVDDDDGPDIVGGDEDEEDVNRFKSYHTA